MLFMRWAQESAPAPHGGFAPIARFARDNLAKMKQDLSNATQLPDPRAPGITDAGDHFAKEECCGAR
jgi:hypothetical protein